MQRRVGTRAATDLRVPLPTRAEPRKARLEDYGWPFLVSLVAFAALAALFLLPYVARDIRYPVGWDAANYVRKAQSVTYEGLSSMGTIRAGVSLLLGVLVRTTGQNAFTLVAVVPPVLAGVAALGAAGMVRPAVGMRSLWIPVIGFFAWAAFGENRIIALHLDNLLNVALVLAAFAASLAFVEWGRGAIATALLLMAAALAHWPFYLFALAAYILGLMAFVGLQIRGSVPWRGAVLRVAPLGGAAVLSAALAGFTLLFRPDNGWIGVRLSATRRVLRQRFLARVRDPYRYYAVPLALVGALGVGRTSSPPARPDARRLFLCLMAAWVLLTVVGDVLQFAGLPTAGARLLYMLFPLTILAGLGLWWLARWLAARQRGYLGIMAAAVLVLGTITAFGALAETLHAKQHRAWITHEEVRQVEASGTYLARSVPTGKVAYLLGPSSSDLPVRSVIRAVLGPKDTPRLVFAHGSPLSVIGPEYSQDPSLVRRVRSARAVIAIEAYNTATFADAAALQPRRIVAPGVLVLRGPTPQLPLPAGEPVTADTRLLTLAWTVAAIVAILFAAGSGWSVALLPADPIVRVTLAPSLGLAVITLVALAWDRLGLTFASWGSLGPLAIAVAAGWVVPILRRMDLAARLRSD